MKKLTDENKIEIVKRYLEGESCGKIAKDFPVTRASIRGILLSRNIKPRNRKDIRKHLFNESFFDIVDNENKAYWLGFIFADGNVYKNTVSIVLEGKDKEHLAKFAKDIGFDYEEDYRPLKNAYRIRLHSKHMTESLYLYGVVPRKSAKIQIPELPINLIIPFLRGFFDGDGSIYSRPIERRMEWTVRVSSISVVFLEKFKKIIADFSKSDTGYINAHSLSWCGNWNALSVAELLYNNASIYLERKFKIFQEMKEYLKTRKKNKWGKN